MLILTKPFRSQDDGITSDTESTALSTPEDGEAEQQSSNHKTPPIDNLQSDTLTESSPLTDSGSALEDGSPSPNDKIDQARVGSKLR